MNEKQGTENASPMFQFLMERWQARGVGQRFPSCFIVEEFTRFANERNDARRIPQFENWLLIFDELVNWFSSLALALKRAFLTGDEPKSVHLSVMTVLATEFAADLCSIRRLMLDGFEVQARVLTRSAVETVELMFVVPYHPEIERAFYNANDFEKTNAFWYEHIRKGKLRTKAMTGSGHR